MESETKCVCDICKLEKYTSSISACEICDKKICDDCWPNEENKIGTIYTDICYDCDTKVRKYKSMTTSTV